MLDISISNASTTAWAISVSDELGEQIQQLSRDQKSLEKRLLKDSTKTKSAKRMAAAEAAQKKLMLAAKKAERIQTGLRQSIERYDEVIDKKMQILGTTDYLILGGYAQALQDKNPIDVMKLQDLDAIRASLLHPVMKLNSSVQGQREALTEAAAKMIIGEDDYKEREELKVRLDAAEKLEIGILETHNDYKREADAVRQNMVTDSDLEPALG